MTDPIVDLVDPIRLVISLLPPTWQAPAAVVVSTLASVVTVASLIVSRLPLSARQHPRYGWAVRLLHRVSLLRLRDELGSTKLPGAEVAPRVTVAPAVLPLVESAGKAGAVAVSETRGGFDPTAHITRAQMPPIDSNRGFATLRALLAVVVLFAVAMAALGIGCGPRVIRDPVVATPPDGCLDGATTCHNGAPWRFSAGAWSQADRQCNRLATDASAVVCCLTPSALRPDASVHACVPMALCSPEVSR